MQRLSESTEDYLETIYVLGLKGATVRSVDIAHNLGFSKPSVSIAMKSLREQGYTQLHDGGAIILTSKGREIAKSIYQRHKLITEWLMFLGVDEKTALRDACKMEHGMSDASYQALKDHVADLMGNKDSQ